MAVSVGDAWSDRIAVVDGPTRLSFADVALGCRRVAAALIARGVERGDRVALWAPNSSSWIVAALGIQASGAWLVPLNTRFKSAEAAYILDRTDAAALMVVDEFLGVDYVADLQSARADLRALGNVVRVPGPGRSTSADWADFLADAPPHLDAAEHRIAATGPDDVCDVIFTSGTTGKPKGVMLRHGTSLRCYESYNAAYGLALDDRHLVTTPFFHCFGYKAGWMLSLLAGATTYPVAVFDPGEALALIEAERITHMPGAPTVFSSLLDHPLRRERDLGSLDTAIVAAATIPAPLVLAMRAELGFRTVMSGYGLTENHALGTFTRRDDPIELVSTTVGRPAPDITVRIVDEEGREVPHGSSGEILLGGYAHMSGYYDEQDATEEVLRDGWLHTGDIGRIDDDGLVTITDRKKDMFIMGGFNVAPAEVEAGLLQLESIAQVAVVGIPDDHYGEVGCAFVVPTTAARDTLDAATVLEWARAAMANYKVPRRVEIVDQLPTNATGKVLKHVLREKAAASQQGGCP